MEVMMVEKDYYNFDLFFDRVHEGYRVRVISPFGEPTVHFQWPFSKDDLENFLTCMASNKSNADCIEPEEKKAATETVKKLGEQLFKAVFKEEVLTRFGVGLEGLKQREGLRLRLIFADDVPELAVLPWEYLYYQARDRFLALYDDTPIVRYLRLPKSVPLLPVKSPLRVLVMISRPLNYSQLKVEEEWTKLHEALSDLDERNLMELERLEEATLEALQQRLQQKEYHIFHYIGHGHFDQQAEDATLILETAEKLGDQVSGPKLGALLSGHPSLRMVIFNACDLARASQRDLFAGAAQSLVRQGIPAVIAMQFEIMDETAITFAHELYRRVASKLPIDAALAHARMAIFLKSVEWGTPVLFMRSQDGRIFDFKQDPEKMEENPNNVNPTKLRQIITTDFDEGELRTLCFDLRSTIPKLDYDSLPGMGKADKARELVLFFERHGRLAELDRICRDLRPNASW
jgi:hypothetical protein